jgi:hypothetical protein
MTIKIMVHNLFTFSCIYIKQKDIFEMKQQYVDLQAFFGLGIPKKFILIISILICLYRQT